MKLDLGAGPVSPEGYTPLGRRHGSEIYPLPYEDGSIEAIRASHVLEHFPSLQVNDVVKEWARVLKPGGVMQIAVPDFYQIVQNFLIGVPQPTEGYIMGGQVDEHDFHRSLFDKNRLGKCMMAAGLVGIERWESDIEDAACLPISLNLEGRKP